MNLEASSIVYELEKENEKDVLAPITIISRLGSETVITLSPSLGPDVQAAKLLQSLIREGIAFS